MGLTSIDWIIMAVYSVFVLGIGVALKRYMKTSTDFFLAGRSIPAWVCGLAFISANLGAQEVIGMGASGAKYGIATSHFYWIGAIPAMVFVGIFMMPFYYGSRARSVPEYLRLRFDEKTRGLNAISFATMTIFRVRHGETHADAAYSRCSSPEHGPAPVGRFSYQCNHLRDRRADLYLAGRIGQRNIQRSTPIFSDRGRLSASGPFGAERCRRLERN